VSISAIEGIYKAGPFQRDVEHRLESVVENGITGMIREVRNKYTNGFVSGFLCRTGEKLFWQAETGKGQQQRQSTDRGVFPDRFLRWQWHECLIGDRPNHRRRNAQPGLQMLCEFVCTGKPILRLDFKRFFDDVAKCLWNRGIDFAKRLRFFLQALPECRERRVRVVWRLAYHQLVKNHP